jgi:hypothetical protein
LYILVVYFYKFNPGVDRWQLLTTHTSKSLCEPDMRISMFKCDVPQTLFFIKDYQYQSVRLSYYTKRKKRSGTTKGRGGTPFMKKEKLKKHLIARSLIISTVPYLNYKNTQ